MKPRDEISPDPGGGLPEALGIELLDAEGDVARGRIAVTERTLQPYGIVHGGTFAALAETVASAATHMHVAPDGMLAIGQSNHTTFLRPVTGGRIEARATTRHRGRTTWVWDVDMSDADGRICAISRVVVAVREPRG
ncbi:MAG TPA: PaaI family thioesterase [Solirubrobacterales bacterium]|nr:PaaI family thioesterase [Solirubrobacterales bacterium]